MRLRLLMSVTRHLSDFGPRLFIFNPHRVKPSQESILILLVLVVRHFQHRLFLNLDLLKVDWRLKSLTFFETWHLWFEVWFDAFRLDVVLSLRRNFIRLDIILVLCFLRILIKWPHWLFNVRRSVWVRKFSSLVKLLSCKAPVNFHALVNCLVIGKIVLSWLNSYLLDLLLLFFTNGILTCIFVGSCFAIIETGFEVWLYRVVQMQPSCVVAAVHYEYACIVKRRGIRIVMLNSLLLLKALFLCFSRHTCL